MAEEPQEIIERIALTRSDIGRAAEALAARLDVAHRLRGATAARNGGPPRSALRRVIGTAAGRLAVAMAIGVAIGRRTLRRRAHRT